MVYTLLVDASGLDLYSMTFDTINDLKTVRDLLVHIQVLRIDNILVYEGKAVDISRLTPIRGEGFTISEGSVSRV